MAVKNISLIVGARPNFMKAAPLLKQLQKYQDSFHVRLIHTGQHYDDNLSKFFFEDLNLPEPDIYLGTGSGTHAEQTGKVMTALEQEFLKDRPDLVMVFGDINSTMAAGLVTSKMMIQLAHIESGLRSFDRTMPEEINRVVTDQLADLLFVTEPAGVDNLRNEGIDNNKIHLVGNLMIDSLIDCLTLSDESAIIEKLGLGIGDYAVMTLHRPANVDSSDQLRSIIDCVNEISIKLPVVFTCHPRTAKRIEQFGFKLEDDKHRLKIINPLRYIDFLKLVRSSKMVISDSGGLQADASYLNIPCLTLRENTEQPVTIEKGTNTLCGTDRDTIMMQTEKVLKGEYKTGQEIELWDGNAAKRIVEILLNKPLK